jgi:hypothetical protein
MNVMRLAMPRTLRTITEVVTAEYTRFSEQADRAVKP